MANRITLNVSAQLATPAGIVPITFALSVAQTATAFDRRTVSVESEADDWTEYTVPTEVASVYLLVIMNPATNANAVNYALTAAATYQPAEIPPGAGVVIFKPSASQVFLSHLGGTGTVQPVEIMAIAP